MSFKPHSSASSLFTEFIHATYGRMTRCDGFPVHSVFRMCCEPFGGAESVTWTSHVTPFPKLHLNVFINLFVDQWPNKTPEPTALSLSVWMSLLIWMFPLRFTTAHRRRLSFYVGQRGERFIYFESHSVVSAASWDWRLSRNSCCRVISRVNPSAKSCAPFNSFFS